MAEPTLEFIARSLERLTADVAELRDDMRVLTAIVMRQDNTLTRLLDEQMKMLLLAILKNQQLQMEVWVATAPHLPDFTPALLRQVDSTKELIRRLAACRGDWQTAKVVLVGE